MTRRTKIVATIGPSSRAPECVRQLIVAGIDVARLNFAHGEPDQHSETTATVRRQAQELGRVVGVLADLPGPKMRTGPVRGGEVELNAGERFILTDEDVEGDSARVSTTLKNIADVCEEATEIFLADGEIVLKVVERREGEVITEIVRGGVLRSGKGMHIPGSEHKVGAFTDDDKKALQLALQLKLDYVGLSFIRDESDVKRVREALPKRGPRPLLVAKIETRAAVESLNGIVEVADAVMVARGDLGIQTPITRVPLLQKEIIHSCNRAGVPVITATQMLESMTRSPIPTRAEVTDVANAVVDGTDALMLSEETAIGDHPVEAVKIMAQTAEQAEAWPTERAEPQKSELIDDPVSWAVAHAAVEAAEYLGVAAIVCPTRSGSTPRRVSAFRPTMSIIGLTKRHDVIGSLTLLWGVTPIPGSVHVDPIQKLATEDVDQAMEAVKRAGLMEVGELAVVVAGSPGPRAGRTDYIRVVRA